MVERMRLQAERAKREGRITVDQVKLLLQALRRERWAATPT